MKAKEKQQMMTRKYVHMNSLAQFVKPYSCIGNIKQKEMMKGLNKKIKKVM
jgi:hypothetical protein